MSYDLIYQNWLHLKDTDPYLFSFSFVFIFALLSALSIPGGAVLAVVAGNFYGWWTGALVVGAASTLGAVIPFWLARRWGRARLPENLKDFLSSFDSKSNFKKDAILFVIRLIPVIPYPLLNPTLGMTKYPTWRFVIVSFLSLTLGTLPYSLAGHSLDHLKENFRLVDLFVVVGVLLAFTVLLYWVKQKLKKNGLNAILR